MPALIAVVHEHSQQINVYFSVFKGAAYVLRSQKPTYVGRS